MASLRFSNQAGYKALVTNCLTEILAVGHFFFQEHFRRLPDAALAQRGHDDFLIAVKTGALHISVRGGGVIMPHERLSGGNAASHKRDGDPTPFMIPRIS